MKLSSLALCQDNVCYPSESLKKRSSVESRDGVHKLILQETGNLELICRDDVLWSSNTENSDADRFQFQSDGNLVIRKKDGTFGNPRQCFMDPALMGVETNLSCRMMVM